MVFYSKDLESHYLYSFQCKIIFRVDIKHSKSFLFQRFIHHTLSLIMWNHKIHKNCKIWISFPLQPL